MGVSNSDYIHSLDALRAFAAFAVVTLHTQPFMLSGFFPPDELCHETAVVLNVLALFAVPFFFAASGYLMGRAVSMNGRPNGESLRTVVRTFKVFAFWTALYFVVPRLQTVADGGLLAGLIEAVHETRFNVGSTPVSVILNGGSYQLWFLSSLIQAALIVWLFDKTRMSRLLPAAALGLYAFGLLGQGYGTLFSINVDINTRIGPFFGLLPFVIGYRLASGQVWSVRNSLFLAGFGLALVFIEVWTTRDWNAGNIEHYYIGSVPLAAGLLMAALGSPAWAAGTIWPHLGRMSLGIYGSHAVFIGWVEEYDFPFMESVIWQFIFPVAVFLCAWITSEGLARIPGLSSFCGRCVPAGMTVPVKSQESRDFSINPK